MTTAVTHFDNIKAIHPDIIAEQRAGKWYSRTRVLLYAVEDQKFTIIRAEWYERMLAAFLKLFGKDYFAKVFKGKNATLMTPDEVDAIRNANETGLKKLDEMQGANNKEVNSKPTADAIKVTEMLSAHYKEVNSNVANALAPSPEIKMKGQAIALLLPSLGDASLPISQENKHLESSLLTALINTDPNCFKKLVPQLKPAILKQIVDICLTRGSYMHIMHEEQTRSDTVLALIGAGLESLPNTHPLLEAFVQAFPANKQLPTLPQNLNYEDRERAVSGYIYHDEHKPAKNRAHHCLKFVLSPAFEKLMPSFNEDQKTRLIQNLCDYGIFFFYIEKHMLIDNEKFHKKLQELFDLAQRFAPHCRLILESFSQHPQAEFLAHLCLQDQADKALVEKILSRNPADKLEWAKTENARKLFYASPDPFFSTFIRATTTQNKNKERLLEWLMDIVFTGNDENRKNELISHLRMNEQSFLATHFAQLPQPIAERINFHSLMETVRFALEPHPHSEDNLKAIARALPRSSFSFSDIQNHESAMLALFNSGVVPCQTVILGKVLDFSLDGYNEKLPLILNHLLAKASSEVWYEVGKTAQYSHWEKLNSKCLAAMQTHCTPAALIAFVNGLANSTQPTNPFRKQPKCPHISSFLSLIFQLDGQARAEIPFADISEPALASIESHGMMYSARDRNLYSPKSPPEDYLWYHLLRALKHPENESEKRVLIQLSRQILQQQYYSVSESVPIYLKTLTPEQVKQLPLSTYEKPLQILLHFVLSDSPSTHADKLRELTAGLTADEQRITHDLYEKIGKPQKAEFIKVLIDTASAAPSPFCQTLVKDFCSSADVAELLALPRSLLLANLKSIHKKEVRIELLKQLPDLEVRQALYIWWEYLFNYYSDDNRQLLHDRFPFGSMIAVLEEPEKIRKIAAIPAGTLAVQLIPPGQFTFDLYDVLRNLEKAPWKIWVSIDKLDVCSLCTWNGGDGNPREKFPKCFEIFDWYYTKSTGTTHRYELRELAEKLTGHVQEKRWGEAHELFSNTDENQKNYLLAAVRGPSPEELAKAVKALTPAQLYGSLFDDQARENLKKAFLTGLAPEDGFTELAHMAQCLSKETPFAKEITDSLPSAGGQKCPLREAFNLKDFSDMTVQLGAGRDARSIFAHKLLLSLDPYFKKLLETVEKDKPLVIPESDLAQAEIRLKRLYGTLTMADVATTTGQGFLREINLEPPLSLAPLYNADNGDITLVLDGQTIKAHKFILASALPYFQAILRSSMKEVAQQEVDLTEHDQEHVLNIMKMIYTGKEPEFSENAEKNEFYAMLHYFNPS